MKHVEDENHVLVSCPLYSPIRDKFDFHPNNLDEVAGLLSDKNSCPTNTNALARVVQAILATNECYTAYYKSPDFHSSTGSCVLI